MKFFLLNSQIKGLFYYKILNVCALMLIFSKSNSLKNNIHNEIQKKFEITNYKINYYIDAHSENVCDIKVKEIVSYKLPVTSNNIIHSIVSKKNSFTDLKVKVLTKDVKIKNYNIKNINNQIKSLFDENDNQFYRNRWLFTVELSSSVTSVEMEFQYDIQRAVMIDSVNNNDLVHISFINPFSFYVKNLYFSVFVKNFKNLELGDLKIPAVSTVTKKNNIFEIKTVTSLPPLGLLKMEFTLPLEITVCEPVFVNFVYYGMIVITVIFSLITLIAIVSIYKE